jgi:hypothetical protein
MTTVRNLASKSKIAPPKLRERNAEELPDVFATMARERMEAVVVVMSPLTFALPRRIVELTLKHRLAAAYRAAEWAEAGGLLSLAPSYKDLFRHAVWGSGPHVGPGGIPPHLNPVPAYQ